jgi:hypothetical protein
MKTNILYLKTKKQKKKQSAISCFVLADEVLQQFVS